MLLTATVACGSARATVSTTAGAAGQRGSVTHGVASPGYLGIDVHDVADDQVALLHLHDTRGAVIVRVDHDGPAGKMGLRERDVVTQLNGVAIDGEELLRRMLREMAPGRTVALVISRDGQQISLTAQMADRGQIERQAWEQHLGMPASPQAPANALPSGETAASGILPAGPPPETRYSKSFLGSLLTSASYTGAMLEVMGPQLADFFGVPGRTGLLVRSVADNSPAAMAGLRAGDVVLKANLKPLATMNEWAHVIRDAKGRPVTVTVMRDRQEKMLTLVPDSKRRSALELPDPAGQEIHLARLTEF